MENKFITTKLFYEIRNGVYFSLGYGNIFYSEADVIVVSNFMEEIDSEIDYNNNRLRPGSICKINSPIDNDLNEQQVISICKGYMNSTSQEIENFIVQGLNNLNSFFIANMKNIQIDILPLGVGVEYGKVDKNAFFNIIMQWINATLRKINLMGHLRIVTNNPNSFIEFYDMICSYKKNIEKNEMELKLLINKDIDYKTFNNDILSAQKILKDNPKQVIVICRTIIEKVVRYLIKNINTNPNSTLFESINLLKKRGYLPEYINSYFQTCRVLGNFSNHTDFEPLTRDAEVIMTLTLRIVEWFLNEHIS